MSHPLPVRRAVLARLVLVPTLLVCGACSDQGSARDRPLSSAGQPSARATSEAPPSTTQPTSTTEPSSTTPTAPAGLTAQVTTTPGASGAQETETLSQVVLTRQSGILQMDAVVACKQPETGSTSCTDPVTYAGLAKDVESDGTLAGVEFLDSPAAKTYLAIRSATARPWSSTVPEGLATGSSQRMWLRMAAPPASVTTGTLLFPHGGPRLTGVPIVDGTLPVEPTTTTLSAGPDGVLPA